MMTFPAPPPIGEEATIRSVLNDRLAALYDKDARRLAALYSPEVVSFDLAPPLLWVGPGDPQGWFDTWDGPIVMALAHVNMRVGHQMAWCHCLSHLTGVKTDGEEVDLWFRTTYCLERTDSWRIVHEHHSTPFYMDGSGLACLDLVP
jgi:ketosteroid isomerase-like protein